MTQPSAPAPYSAAMNVVSVGAIDANTVCAVCKQIIVDGKDQALYCKAPASSCFTIILRRYIAFLVYYC